MLTLPPELSVKLPPPSGGTFIHSSPIQPTPFYGVTSFIETIGQRQEWKFDTLDVMQCTWTGPAVGIGAYNFQPTIDSAHPQYPLMLCNSSQTRILEANVVEVQATYMGLIRVPSINHINDGSVDFFYTNPTVTTTPAQGSRDFQREWSAQTSTITIYQEQWNLQSNITGPGIVPIIYRFYSAGSQRVNIRYIGTSAAVHYFVYPEPIGQLFPGNGMGRVNWQILSTYYGEVSIIATNITQDDLGKVFYDMHLPGVPPLFASYLGTHMTQKSAKWWEITDTYGPTF